MNVEAQHENNISFVSYIESTDQPDVSHEVEIRNKIQCECSCCPLHFGELICCRSLQKLTPLFDEGKLLSSPAKSKCQTLYNWGDRHYTSGGQTINN